MIVDSIGMNYSGRGVSGSHTSVISRPREC